MKKVNWRGQNKMYYYKNFKIFSTNKSNKLKTMKADSLGET